MTVTIPTVLVPVYRLRAGDLIRPDGPTETVMSVGDIDAGCVTVRTDAAVYLYATRQDVPTLVPVSHPSDATGLYKADGSGIFGCTCVCRVVDPSLAHEQVAEIPSCPSHGSDRLDDDEWD